MKKLLLFLVLVILTSCQSNESKIKQYFKDTVNDPTSLVFHKIVEVKSENPGEKIYIVNYGAKNGFGGMMRDVATVYMAGDSIRLVESATEKKMNKIVEDALTYPEESVSDFNRSEAERIIDSAAAVTEREMR